MIVDVFECFKAHKYICEIPGVCVEIGAEFLDELSTAPRFVWAPVGSESLSVGQPIRVRPTSAAPRAQAMRYESIRIRIWGKGEKDTPVSDIRATEALLDRAICALRELGNIEISFDRTEWVAADGQEVTQYGRCVDLFVGLAIPVVLSLGDLGLAVAEITTLPASSLTGTMVFEPEGTNETGTPAP